MPVLKCIGGSHDGQYYEVGIFEVGKAYFPDTRFLKKSLARVDNFSGKTRYTMRQLNQVRFLAPDEWSDIQAIEFQFKK